ncbi:MAG: hypothetical protein PHD01_05160 [Geobacteraceae bacterium]|nr:hypothetical protein [Geobacteraceae bacterium]
MIDEYTGKKIVSPLDLPMELKPTDHPEVFIMKAILAMAQHSLCPPTYEKFCHCYNELLNIRRLPLEELD